MKIPADAYETYLSMGSERSYQAIADHYGVSKVAVVKKAKKEGWQARIQELERTAREQFEAEAKKELHAVRERQLKGARALQAKALEALRDLPPERGIKASSALNVAWKHELLLLGEATDRNASVVEEVTRRELNTLLLKDGEEEDWSAFDAPGDDAEAE